MIFLGDLPEPVHGMSNVNAAVLKFAERRELKPKVLNTVPSYAAQYYGTRFWLLFKIMHTSFCYVQFLFALSFGRHNIVYRPINGGSGQIYDLVYLLIARLYGARIYIHHHSFQYLNKHSALFSLLNRVAGKSATHIVLGMQMSDKLQTLYSIEKDKLRIVSNLAFFGSPSLHASSYNQDSNTIILGHLANLSIDKGIDLFVDTCRQLKRMNLCFRAKIAGPFADDQAKKVVMDALEEIPEIDYLGPLYDDDKLTFYASLDCFVFPSKYINEAEPLVLYEAALHGTYLAGTQRGCMQNVIENLGGFSIAENNDPAGNIAHAIHSKLKDNLFKPDARAHRMADFRDQQVKSKELLTLLIEEMRENDLPETR